MTVSYRPLTQWPAGRARTADWKREDSKFQAGRWTENSPGFPNQGSRFVRTRTPLSKTLAELERELSMIDARDVVVQIDVRGDRDLRQDGTGPKTDARVNSPAVVVSFTRNKVPHVFAGDYFKRWEDNLRAIALGLEGLRRLERYHITQAGEQYRGWQALPATTTATMGVETAANVLAARWTTTPERVIKDFSIAKAAYRAAAQRAHPDTGGSTEEFQLVQEAKRILEAHHGVAF